jgi:hypothetical protein
MLALTLTDSVCDDTSRVSFENTFTDLEEPPLHDCAFLYESPIPVRFGINSLRFALLLS